MKRIAILVALLAAALSGGVGRSQAVFVATSTNSANSFTTAADFNSVAVSLTDPGTPLRGTVPLAATASSDRALVSVRFQSAPAGSGTWTDRCTDNVAPYTCDWNTTGLSNGLYDLRAIALDAGGYSQTSTVIANRRVDNAAPTVSLTNPGSPLTGTRTLYATASDTGGSGLTPVVFEYRLDGSTGAWTQLCSDSSSPYSCSWNTAAIADGLYDVRAAATDGAGNSTSSTVGSRRVDNTAPTVTMTDDGLAKSGTITVQATTGDGDGSGVESVRYEYRPAGGGGWTEACTVSTAPFPCDLDTNYAPDGLYDLRAIATDGAGFSTTSNTVTARVDNSDPATATMTNPGSPLSGSVTLNGTATDNGGGSGIASLRFQYAPAGTSSWADACSDNATPYSCAWDTTAVADGVYDLRSLATDNAGNTRASATIASRRVDNLAPAISLDDPGTPLSGTRTLSATASDGGGIYSVVIQRKPTSGSTWTTICTDYSSSFSCSWDTAAVADGSYDLRATATDNAGRTTTSVVNARVVANGPRATAVASGSGGSSGRLSTGDSFTLTYSEAPLAASLVAGWTGSGRPVSIAFSRVGSTTTVAVTDSASGAAVPIGSLTLGDWFTQAGGATFNGTMTLSGSALTLALSGNPTQGSVRTDTVPTTITWTSSTAVTDAAGNAGLATTVTTSGSF